MRGAKGPATRVVGCSGLERGMKCAATRCGEARRRRTEFLLRIRSILPLYPLCPSSALSLSSFLSSYPLPTPSSRRSPSSFFPSIIPSSLSLSLSLFHPVNFHFVLSLLHSDPPLPRLTCLLFPRARPYALSFIPCDPPLFLSRCFCLSPFHPPTQTTAVQSSVGP